MSLGPGSRLGHYEILAPIGAGGMGQVYRARDLRLNRDVALKVLPAATSTDPDRQARFTREAQAAASITHPNVAVVYDTDVADGVTFIAMELVVGEPLSHALQQGALSGDRALDIAIDVARGLAAAHDRGVLHRDLKPANIMLTPEGHAKLIDFGLAKVMSESSQTPHDLPTVTSNDTRAGVVLGTAHYMSPEQARGHRVDARSDVFSFGIVLHELLAGSRPFTGPSSADVLAAVISQPHPRLPRLNTRARLADLQRVVDRCLAKSPDARYPSIAHVIGDLEAARRAAPAAGSSRLRWLVPAAAALGLATLAGWWTFRGGADELRWAHDTGLPELRRLVGADAYAEAFALAARIERVLPDDPTLRELWPRMAQVVSVSTSPGGAEVRLRPVSAPDSPWESLGPSPLVERRFPFGAFWLRVEAEGFAPFEALYGGPSPYADPSRPRTIAVELERAGTETSGSVRVPDGPAPIDLVGFDEIEALPLLPAFWIDRVEVTNRAYKAFVDAGGYRDPSRWHHVFTDGSRHLTFDEAMSRFVDQTGRPGPATWEVGTFSDGGADHPVSGVSWYEAAAYCASVGRALPTVFHWTAAARPGLTSAAVLPTSNFGERGLRPVASGRPGLHGTHDMAGNVKEWTWNEAGGARYILGGAWSEPGYQFYEHDAQAPMARRAGFGFRCAEYSDLSPEHLAAARREVPLPVPMTSADPIPDDVFEAYKALFTFDRVPMEPRQIERDTSNPAWIREKVAFRAAYGAEDVFVYLFLPVGGRPPFQPVVYFPGTTAQRQRSPEQLQTRMFDFLVQSGRAVVYPIYTGTHERRLDRVPSPDSRAGVDYTARLASDLQRTVDYLATRTDVRMDALAYAGFSWGAELAPLFMALDSRFRVAVLLDGGLGWGARRPEINRASYAPRVRIPTLMINGSYDATFQLDASQKPLFALLGSPVADKRHVLYPTGHAVFTGYRNQAIQNILDWLDRYLGPTS